MNLQLKHLAGYLPYGLNVIDEEISEKFHVAGFNTSNNEFLIHDNIDGSIEEYSVNLLKPILRPLSDLTKEIEVNGKKFVPLAVITSLEISEEENFKLYGIIPEYWKSFLETKPRYYDYWQVERLLEWHFDIYNLIPIGLAIDINTV